MFLLWLVPRACGCNYLRVRTFKIVLLFRFDGLHPCLIRKYCTSTRLKQYVGGRQQQIVQCWNVCVVCFPSPSLVGFSFFLVWGGWLMLVKIGGALKDGGGPVGSSPGCGPIFHTSILTS